MRIGIDFDNTIAGYDSLFVEAAVQEGLLTPGQAADKRAVKRALLVDGEGAWMRLQGRVYGAYMGHAEMIDGVAHFLTRCRSEAVEVFVISHKTEFGHFDPDRVNLRDAARAWMAAHGFFDQTGFGLSVANVHFAASRDEKIAKIIETGITHFVDDLLEVLDHPGFPPNVHSYYFGPELPGGEPGRHHAFSRWTDIEHHIFD